MTFTMLVEPAGRAISTSNDNSILESALTAGVVLEHSCKNGSCGVCTAELISGTILNEKGERQESGDFLTCSSKPLSDTSIKAVYYPELSGIVNKTFPVKVEQILDSAEDIITIKFRLPPTTDLEYLPGQYVDLSYKGIVRSYSIANAQSVSKGIELHIRKVVNGKMSLLLFSDIQPNTLMRMSGPNGTFFIREDESPIIFIAGGTGFAPVKSMVEELLSKSCKRPIFIYWGMPQSRSFYSDIAHQWADKYENVHYIPVLSENELMWEGRKGYVHQAVVDDFPSLDNYHVYACGSQVMIEVAKKALIEIGLADENFFSDAFTAAK